VVTTLLGLAAVLALILANGYFVAAEFGYVAVDRNAIEADAARGDPQARRVGRVLRRLSFMLSGAQLGITVTSLVVGFIAAPVFRDALEPILDWMGVAANARSAIAVTTGFVVATVGQMLVGELAPKNLAIARPEPVSRRLAASMLVFLRVARPFIRLFDNSSNRLLRAVGIEPVEELSRTVSLAELDIIVEESTTEGSLELAQARLLERALAFPELTASEVAIPYRRVVTLAASGTCSDLRDLMSTGHSRFPVVDDGDVIGVVHVRRLLQVPRAAWPTTRAATLMFDPVLVPETARLPKVLRTLREAATELAVVLDEHGSCVGIVTAEDLAEELVGDISDETDLLSPGVHPIGERSWTVPGSFRIDEVEREIGVELPDGDYDTVAGLIVTELGRLAEPGDSVEVAGTCLTVTETDGRAIATVSIEVLDVDEPDGRSES